MMHPCTRGPVERSGRKHVFLMVYAVQPFSPGAQSWQHASPEPTPENLARDED
jgi:hypothetical protein